MAHGPSQSNIAASQMRHYNVGSLGRDHTFTVLSHAGQSRRPVTQVSHAGQSRRPAAPYFMSVCEINGCMWVMIYILSIILLGRLYS